MLCTTTACTFSTSQLSKVVRTRGVFNILIWKYASRHNTMHLFYMSTSKSGRNLVCFAHFDLEMCFARQPRAIFHLASGHMAPHPTFRLSGATNHWKKHSESRLCYLFARLHLLFSDSFSSLLPTSAFPSVHNVGSLNSKLPSNYIIFIYICIPVVPHKAVAEVSE